MVSISKTKLIFQSRAHQDTTTYSTKVVSVQPYSSLSEADKVLFKAPNGASESIYALSTEATIFHPQGGGQPSDVGEMKIMLDDQQAIFKVLMVRASNSQSGVVLHFGHFATSDVSTENLPGKAVTQTIDVEKRRLYSRFHTAGHVLGAATRGLLESKIENFDELKASHFPDSAACEFQGLIDGKYKPEVQRAVDNLVAKDAEIRIEWWTKADFRTRGVERLLPDDKTWSEIAIVAGEDGEEIQGAEADDEKTRIRVVSIVGAEVYPCGGTHVPSTKSCGKVTVKKISRAKGNSRIGYLVD